MSLSHSGVTTTAAGGEGFGGRGGKILGTCFGRRVIGSSLQIVMPAETREVKALRVILSGHGGQGAVSMSAVAGRVDDLIELRNLIDAIVGLARPESDETRAALVECGIKEPTLSEMLTDEWITPERVRTTWQAIHSSSYRWVNNPIGVLIRTLQYHQEPDADEQQNDHGDGWSYVTGKYADEIEH